MQGGRDAQILGGQVQLWERPGRLARLVGGGWHHVGSGTLISPKWVLTAKHCVEDDGVTTDVGRVRVRVGDRRLGKGEPHGIRSIHKHDESDLALVELQDEAPAQHMVGYTDTVPRPTQDEVQIRGWGLLGEERSSPAPKVLQEMTAVVTDDQAENGPGVGDRLVALDPGTAAIRDGDSGSGWYASGRVCAVTSTAEEEAFTHATREYAYGVPTGDWSIWIQGVSGVAPS